MANTAVATILWGDINFRKGYKRYIIYRGKFYRKLNNFQQ